MCGPLKTEGAFIFPPKKNFSPTGNKKEQNTPLYYDNQYFIKKMTNEKQEQLTFFGTNMHLPFILLTN